MQLIEVFHNSSLTGSVGVCLSGLDVLRSNVQSGEDSPCELVQTSFCPSCLSGLSSGVGAEDV